MDKLDMSLDDIISQTRGRGSNFRGRRSRGGRGNNFSVQRGGVQQRQGTFNPSPRISSAARELPDVWKHDMYDGDSYPQRTALWSRSRGRGGVQRSTRGSLIISNLDYGVNDSDIEELFKEFGALRKAAVHFDRSGRSLGTAEVIYERHSDGLKAMEQYNGVPLDGREMKIRILEGNNRENDDGFANSSMRPRRRNWGGSFGQQRGRGRGRGGRRDEKVPTAEELDAEMDAYNAQMDTS